MIRPLATLIPSCWLLGGMRPSLTPSCFGGCPVLVVAFLVVVVAILVVVVLVFFVGEGVLFPCPHITPPQVERLSPIAVNDQVPVGSLDDPVSFDLFPSGSGKSPMNSNLEGAVSTQPLSSCLESYVDGGPVIPVPSPQVGPEFTGFGEGVGPSLGLDDVLRVFRR